MPDFPRPSTETQLREWRTGQAGSERLAAAILHLDGFEDIDPQAPLGGADDKKDILCRKGATPTSLASISPTGTRVSLISSQSSKVILTARFIMADRDSSLSRTSILD